MRLKTDENLPGAVVNLLKGAGHDVVSVVEEQLGGAADADVIAAAIAEQRALITVDKDFADIRAYPPERAAGIIVLRGADQTVAGLTTLVSRLLQMLDAAELAGRLWIVDERRVRVR